MWRRVVTLGYEKASTLCNRPLPEPFKRCLTTNASRRSEPLRILFCGSDAFSVTALKALYQYSHSSDSGILSIDVATKTDKRTGRGLKILKPPAIKPVALSLGLPLHQFDTFTGWSLPKFEMPESPNINLIIAVSFGLLVPPRILKATKYGGLNVHPSILPDLKGSAPIEHTIIHGYTRTGITVQTLHPSRFDEGVILDQTPQPGLTIPNPLVITTSELKDLLAPIGAEMLVGAIRNRLYAEPHQPLKATAMPPYLRAPKITTQDRAVDFTTMTADQILRKNQAIPKLWVEANVRGTPVWKRILFSQNMRLAKASDLPDSIQKQLLDNNGALSGLVKEGQPFTIMKPSRDIRMSSASILVMTQDHKVICVPQMIVSGQAESPAAAAAAKADFFSETKDVEGLRIHVFHEPLQAVSDPVH